VTIDIEGHTLIAATCRSCAKIRRFGITTPAVTLLVTVGVTGNKKPGVERMITDQQLVGVATTHSSNTCPQSVGTSRFSIVSSSCYGMIDFAFEVGLVSTLVINEDDFSELTKIQTNPLRIIIIIIVVVVVVVVVAVVGILKL